MDSIFKGITKELITSVGSTVRSFVTTKGDKLDHEKDMAELEITISELVNNYELEVQDLHNIDRESARNRDVNIQKAKSSSWLAKNTGYIIDLTMLIILIGVIAGLFFIEIPEQNSSILYMLLGTFIGFLGAIITFYRGSSEGSKTKTSILNKKTLPSQ